jgi:hypothetical protein
MSKETQSYWFSDMGIWGSNPLETYEFGPEHHEDLYKIFDWVHEHEVGDFMAYLQSRPHAFESDNTNDELCVTCKILVDDFGVM